MPITIRDGSAVVKIYPRSVRRRVREGVKTYRTWEVRFTKNGVSHRDSRKTERLARAHAIEQARLLAAGDASVSSLTPADAAAYTRARELLGNTPLEMAVAEYAECRRLLRGHSLSEAVAFWADHHRTNALTIPHTVPLMIAEMEQDGVGKRQRDGLRNRLTLFARTHQCPLGTLTTDDLESWLRDQQKERGWSGQTRNHYRIALIALETWHKRKGWLPRDWHKASSIPVSKIARGRVLIYQPAELMKLLTAAAAHAEAKTILPFIAIGALAGLRHSEICEPRERRHLDWQDIHWAARTIHVAKGKVRTAGERLAPLLPTLKTWIEPLAKEKGPIVVHHNINKLLREVAAAAGVELLDNGLRHSFVSYRLAATKNLQQVSEETGTDAKTLVKYYRRPVSKRVATAWFQVKPVWSRKNVRKVNFRHPEAATA
jgi:hypothetical protein